METLVINPYTYISGIDGMRYTNVKYECCATVAIYCGLSPEGELLTESAIMQRILELSSEESPSQASADFVTQMFEKFYSGKMTNGTDVQDWYDEGPNVSPHKRVEHVEDMIRTFTGE
jgi:hypothetical protein